MPDRKGVLKNFVGLAALVMGSSLSAQTDDWQAYADTWRRGSRAPLTLLVPDSMSTAPHEVADETFFQLTRARDLDIEHLEAAAFIRLRQARGWPEGPRWVLLDREGRALAEGVALPTGATLRDHLLSLGLQPTWEALDQFLVLHPDSGFALDRRLRLAFRLSTARFRLLRGQGQGEGLMEATDSRWPSYRPARMTHPEGAAGISREVVDTLHRLNRLPDGWRTDRDFLAVWLTIMGALDAPAVQPEVALLREAALGVWQARPHTGSTSVPGEGSPGVEGLSAFWLATQAGSASLLDLDSLARMQPSPGHLWPSSDLLSDLARYAMQKQQARELLGFLDRLPDSPPPEGAWAEGWAALRNSPEIAPWGPEELRLEAPTEADTRRLEQVQVSGDGWAVFRGETDIVATGRDAPNPTRLALQLRAVAPSRIQQLDVFLGKHPDQLDARRDRYNLARARMPLPALEERLLEDAVAATIPVDFGPEAPWLSTPEKWRFQARRVVPELAAALQRWPANRSLWQAWLAWSAFLPAPRPVVAFAEGLPVFGPRSSWKALLPAAAHRAVAAEFRKNQRFELMADWFREPWRGIVAPPEEKPSELPSATEDETAIHEAYLEALKALKQTTEAAEAERRWRQARGSAPAKKP